MTGVTRKSLLTIDKRFDPPHGLLQCPREHTDFILIKVFRQIGRQMIGTGFIHLLGKVYDRGNDSGRCQPADPESQNDDRNHAGDQNHRNSKLALFSEFQSTDIKEQIQRIVEIRQGYYRNMVFFFVQIGLMEALG